MGLQQHQPEFRFCPVCGGLLSPRILKESEPERLVCTECRFVFYLDPKVVACTILEEDGRILLLQRGIEPRKGKWVIPGGYVERGEEVKAAAVRETQEECGILCQPTDLVGVYSYEGRIPVVVVYAARRLSGEARPQDETLALKWVPRVEIPWEELAFPSTVDALKDYCALRMPSKA